jgi:GNAT superfamily N-acetyltransferase
MDRAGRTADARNTEGTLSTEITIRPARPEDQPALLHIVWQTVLASDQDRATLLAHPEVVQVPAEQLTAATGCVAEFGGSIAGFAIVLPRPDGAAELDGLFVEPALQRRGIGRALVEESKRLARAMGASVLHVTAADDALAFYESMGFIQTGRTNVQFGTAPLMELGL